jgi:hypothetical protein
MPVPTLLPPFHDSPLWQGEPLEYVVGQVFPGGDIPAVLSKRQFLALAHVAEVAQSKAFDLVTAEDALRAHAPPSSHKKRPLAIRDARIDRWHISAATPPALPEEHSDAPQYGAAAALAPGAPGPLESHLSRAESLPLPAGPLEHGARALSRQNSADDLVAAAQQAQRAQRAQPLQSGATSYQSANDHEEEEEAQAGASDLAQAAAEGATDDGAEAREPAAAGPEDSEGVDSAVQDFTAKLNVRGGKRGGQRRGTAPCPITSKRGRRLLLLTATCAATAFAGPWPPSSFPPQTQSQHWFAFPPAGLDEPHELGGFRPAR